MAEVARAQEASRCPRHGRDSASGPLPTSRLGSLRDPDASCDRATRGPEIGPGLRRAGAPRRGPPGSFETVSGSLASWRDAMRLGLIGATGHWHTYASALGRVRGLTLVAVATAGPEETTGAFDHAP